MYVGDEEEKGEGEDGEEEGEEEEGEDTADDTESQEGSQDGSQDGVSQIQRGGQGQYWSGSPEKSQSYQASI